MISARNDHNNSIVCNQDPIPPSFFKTTFTRNVDNILQPTTTVEAKNKCIRVYLGFGNDLGTMSHEGHFDEGTKT
jgi:hypothetical protein